MENGKWKMENGKRKKKSKESTLNTSAKEAMPD
jgi:hypothetical protein